MGTGTPATPEQLAAGVDNFKKYGNFNLIWALCEAYPVTPAGAEQIEFSYAIQTMQYQNDRTAYNQAFADILSKKLPKK